MTGKITGVIYELNVLMQSELKSIFNLVIQIGSVHNKSAQLDIDCNLVHCKTAPYKYAHNNYGKII